VSSRNYARKYRRQKKIRKIDPNQSYLWKWLPSNGKSGGLLMGVSTNNYDVGSFVEGEFML
jgi:hypothetical protein